VERLTQEKNRYSVEKEELRATKARLLVVEDRFRHLKWEHEVRTGLWGTLSYFSLMISCVKLYGHEYGGRVTHGHGWSGAEPADGRDQERAQGAVRALPVHGVQGPAEGQVKRRSTRMLVNSDPGSACAT
jgi:hypothetical protein